MRHFSPRHRRPLAIASCLFFLLLGAHALSCFAPVTYVPVTGGFGCASREGYLFLFDDSVLHIRSIGPAIPANAYPPFWARTLTWEVTPGRFAIAYLVLLLPVGCIVAILAWYLMTYDATGLCRKCGYDIFGNTSGTCPECGAELSLQIEADARRVDHENLLRSRHEGP